MDKVRDLKHRIIIRRIIRTFVTLSFLGLIFSAAYFIYKNPLLRVNQVKVSGNITIPERDIIESAKKVASESWLLRFLTDDNMFIWGNINANKIKTSIPRLASVIVSSNFKDRSIEIKVSERRGINIWCLTKLEDQSDKSCYWLDEEGKIFDAAPDAIGNLVRVVNDATGRSFLTDEMPLSDTELENFGKVSDFLEKWDLSVETITLTNYDPSELSVRLVGGQIIYFNLNADPSFGNSVIATIKQLNQWEKVNSLDLRVYGKGFYRLK